MNFSEYCQIKNLIFELKPDIHYDNSIDDDSYIFYNKDNKCIIVHLNSKNCNIRYNDKIIIFQKYIIFFKYISNIKYFSNKIRKLKYNKLNKI